MRVTSTLFWHVVFPVIPLMITMCNINIILFITNIPTWKQHLWYEQTFPIFFRVIVFSLRLDVIFFTPIKMSSFLWCDLPHFSPFFFSLKSEGNDTSCDDLDTEDSDPSGHPANPTPESRSSSKPIDVTPIKEKFKKSLRLSSEQIVKFILTCFNLKNPQLYNFIK